MDSDEMKCAKIQLNEKNKTISFRKQINLPFGAFVIDSKSINEQKKYKNSHEWSRGQNTVNVNNKYGIVINKMSLDTIGLEQIKHI